MKGLMIKDLYNLEETIAADLFDGVDYPWQVLPKIGEFILKLGPTLPKEEYDQVGDDVWIAKSAVVFPSAYENTLSYGCRGIYACFGRGKAGGAD